MHLFSSCLFGRILSFTALASLGALLSAQAPNKTVTPHADDFKAYVQPLPGTELSIDMVPVQGGEFLMGSPESETGRKPDEGPQHQVKVDPFWMGKYEITWDLYELFVYKQIESAQTSTVSTKSAALVDAVTHPTPPYVEMSFGMGKVGFPAVNMTQYAALQYCKWLTSKTGVFYRLPTEAEWEYACRAGTTTAYSFGNDLSQLKEHGWFFENSNNKYQQVGKKKANPWGLHDMHGNVAEWTYDQYVPDFYAQAAGVASNPVARPTKLYPHAVRGGSWDDDADRLRSAARRASNPKWKQRDPQIPRSNWWMTNASFVGFRVVRPLKQPSKEEIAKYWLEAIKDA
ncbi:MAG: formylglycine-generating enzyme family protein [Cytophagales bacterium]|nr:formylglycine-generating enzyme family protein [Cytophagales bacterium]